MDKKQAEEEAIRKSKETTHAAGKNTGMSGRDLVRLTLPIPLTSNSRLLRSSSPPDLEPG